MRLSRAPVRCHTGHAVAFGAARGVRTAPWWERQLDLCTIGIMATFAWEKALGDASELGWWEARVAAAIARCGIRTGR